jgi:CRISPR-associated protein Cst2
MTDLNLFATVLTYAAPSSNYHGESEENRTVIQKISRGGHEYAVISPEAMRNALREMLGGRGLPLNRTRLHNEDQLAVKYESFPDAAKFTDDFLFGFFVADNKAIAQNKTMPAKRDSVLRMNLAVALSPYRFDATFHQSPKSGGENPPFKNAPGSALLHREVAYTAFQYPFALALGDCREEKASKWTRALLECIGELSDVAGGHARSYYEMAPKSIVLRLTRGLVGGYDTYGFDESGGFPELKRINKDDLPGKEFWLGGELVRNLPPERTAEARGKEPENERERLKREGVHLFDSPQTLLAAVADRAELGKV